MTRRALAELDKIVARTASLGGHIRQFEMDASELEWVKLRTLQEHLEETLGMLRTVCRILIEDSE